MAGEIGIPAPPVQPTPPLEPTPPPAPIVTPDVEAPPAPEPPTAPAPAPEPQPGVSGGGGAGLSDLLILAAILAALGFAQLFAYLTDFFNWLVRLIFHGLGQGGRAPQLTPLQWGKPLTSAVGRYVSGVDAQVGADFAAMGQTVARVGRAILAAELTLYHAVARLLPLEGQVAAQARTAGHLSTRLSQQEAAQDAQTTKATQAQAQARQRAHGLAQRLTTVEQHLGAVVETQHQLVHHTIPDLRLGAAVTRDRLRQHSEMLGADGLELGVAAALGTLGASWVRCDNTGQLGRANCGLPSNLLRNLLADLAVLGLGAFTLIALAEWGQSIIHLTDTAVEDFWSVTRRGSATNPRIGQAG